MSAPIVIMDTETTGLHPTLDEIWEFAAVRREPDGTERALHLFIEHEPARCEQLPERFLEDHLNRWPGHVEATPRADAAFLIDTFLREPAGAEKPHIVGAVPNFDTERLALLLSRHLGPGWRWPAHYHLIDIENLVVGWLRARFPDVPLDPPWDSNLLSEAVGVPVVEEERHTAMGDVLWAKRIYDKIMKGI